MEERESLPVVTLRCKDCQFYRVSRTEDEGNYCWCTFWSDENEALTEPDGYCHNALPHQL